MLEYYKKEDEQMRYYEKKRTLYKSFYANNTNTGNMKRRTIKNSDGVNTMKNTNITNSATNFD